MLWRIAFIAARLCLAVFVILTAGYCLLAYIPFTYHQVHLGGLLPWLSAFAQFHPYLYWPVFLAAAATLPGLRNRGSRLGSVLFLVVYATIGVRLLLSPLLVRLENNLQSLLWCVLALTPMVWLALLDWRAESGKFRWTRAAPPETPRLFWACLLAALYAWLFSAVLVLARYVVITNAGLDSRQWMLALAGSLVCHVVLFMAIFLAVNFTGAIAGIVFKSPVLRSMAYAATAAMLLALVLKFIAFVPLSFSGSLALLVALAVAFSVVAFLSGTGVRLYRAEERELESPLALLLVPIRFLRSLPRTLQVVVLLAGSALGAWLLVTAGPRDWEYLIQKLIIAAIWAALFAFFYVTPRMPAKRGGNFLVIAAAVLICLYVGFVALQPRWQVLSEKGSTLEDYANYDVSFRLARGVLFPPAAVAADDSLYAFLVSNTNIPRSIHTDPVDINLAGTLTETPGLKPNIFVVVIDSLRPDYLSAYNPAVTFTPNIEAFGRESIVVHNAFTRYTGTGLSEPSIWTGTMMLHKQYVTPFYPMNSLQKLLEFEQYRQFITRDGILNAILAPTNLQTELDAGRPTMSCELCRSLGELETRIAAARAAGHPMFAYTQPQNIHVSVINREGRSVPPGESYPGFDAPYASRVKTMDKCFGDFVQFLKSSGLYDNSIVVLTSDHGDSLGERGRWGHAYHVTPEVVRIPIMIHLPPAMRSLSFDPLAPTFLIDITPSLYYLLGHRPIAKNELFGRPLFTNTPQEAASYIRSSYMVASSYGPVYGLLENAGHSLYVADAVEYNDHLYQWSKGEGVSNGTVTPEIRADRQQQIRDTVNQVRRFYNFNEPSKP
ncbi:MAG TPA: sulfatase-like hydrolase/transferase [Candidatus Angelobacter sp.]|nr:sulfatase-like hydrolase/transferase [Candidatus Angelobacter sp.]